MRMSEGFKRDSFLGASVFILSVLVISYQISLIHALEYLSYSRFAQLIISLALLGFGASGTFLSFFRIERRESPFFFVSIIFLLLVISLPCTYLLAVKIPLDIQYIFFSVRQFLRFLAFALCFFVPFFLSAILIGGALSLYRKSVHIIYGANLLGSGIGGLLVLPLMLLVPQTILPLRLAGLALSAYVCWEIALGSGGFSFKSRVVALVVIVVGAAVSITVLKIRPEITPDQFKTVSHIKRLEKQGSAENIWSRKGPRGFLEVYASPAFHDALFAGPQSPSTPPEQYFLLQNGEHTGTVYIVDDPGDAEILDYTPQSLPYRIQRNPKVLLLGETGGTNIILARRYNAASITVVQENPHIIRLWREVLPEHSGKIFSGEGITMVDANPRLYLKTAEQRFDIIHIAAAEGMPATRSGLYSSEENYLLTVEGMEDCYRLLSDGGCVSVTMGLQSPPRDNIKITAICYETLKRAGRRKPGNHYLQGKNYLAATTMLFKNPVTDRQKRKYTAAVNELQMDSEWHPGIKSSEIRQIHSIPGPEGTRYSYLHHAAQQIFSGQGERFFKEYMYDVKPAWDNKPYFHHFFRWKSLSIIAGTSGASWFRSSELGYLLLICTFLGITFFSFLFILIPHLLGGKEYLKPVDPGTDTGVGPLRPGKYLFVFPAIGIGFMFVEMALIHKLGIFLGSPVYSIAAVITSMLVFSGAGSVIQGNISAGPAQKIMIAAAGVILFLGISLLLFDPFVGFLAGRDTSFRFTAALLFVAPVSFFLGWFFAGSVKALTREFPRAVPLGWGLNGFASVAAAPLATILAVWLGFDAVLGIGMGMYFIVALGSLSWKTTNNFS